MEPCMETFVAAKIMVQHPTLDQVLLVMRERSGIFYGEPCGGRVEIDWHQKRAETLEVCAQREAMEELGVEIYDLKYVGNYTFFWTKRENVCSICVLFTAKTHFTGEIKAVADEGCYPAYPQWIAMEDILSEKVLMDPTPLGLASLMQGAVLSLRKNHPV